MSAIDRRIYPYSNLTPEQRKSFADRISPSVVSARHARRELDAFGDLETRQLEIYRLRESAGPSDYQSVLDEISLEIEQQRDELGGRERRKEVQEQYRLAVNNVIKETNSQRKEALKGIGLQTSLTAVLTNKPQIPFISLERAEPASPPYLHHGMGVLPTHREPDVPNDIRNMVVRALQVRPGGRSLDRFERDVIWSVACLLPDNCRRSSVYHRPSTFRDTTRVAQDLIDVAAIVLAYDRGELTRPRVEQYATPSSEQAEFIASAVTFILVNELHEELTHLERDEDEFRKAIQKNISRELNVVAERIGPDGKGIVAGTIESLPDVQAALLRSRLSITMDVNLGFPRADLAHEKRFAEMLSQAIFANRSPIRRSLVVNLMLGKMAERTEVGDIDLNLVMAYLQSLNYGPYLVKETYEAADSDNREILEETFSSTGHFREFSEWVNTIDNEEDYS